MFSVCHDLHGLPYRLYCFRHQDGTEKSKRVFVNVPTEVGQTEAEEIGVEHLLRYELLSLSHSLPYTRLSNFAPCFHFYVHSSTHMQFSAIAIIPLLKISTILYQLWDSTSML